MQFNLLSIFIITILSNANGAKLQFGSDDCNTLTSNFTITQVKFGDYSKTLEGSSTINVVKIDPVFYIPQLLYDRIMKTLGARQEGFMYGVPCDSDSVASYPNLVFFINGGQLNVPPKAYIDMNLELKGLCNVNLDTASTWQFTYGIPQAFQDNVCQLLKDAKQ